MCVHHYWNYLLCYLNIDDNNWIFIYYFVCDHLIRPYYWSTISYIPYHLNNNINKIAHYEVCYCRSSLIPPNLYNQSKRSNYLQEENQHDMYTVAYAMINTHKISCFQFFSIKIMAQQCIMPECNSSNLLNKIQNTIVTQW